MVRKGGERKIAKTLKKQRMFKEGIQAGIEQRVKIREISSHTGISQTIEISPPTPNPRP